jgi:hypothetical protein
MKLMLKKRTARAFGVAPLTRPGTLPLMELEGGSAVVCSDAGEPTDGSLAGLVGKTER